MVRSSTTFRAPLRRRSGSAAVRAVQITALIIGKLLLARLEADVVAGGHQAAADGRAPPSVGARLNQRVSHRGQLVLDRAPRRGVDRGGGFPMTPLWGPDRQSRSIHPPARRVARLDPSPSIAGSPPEVGPRDIQEPRSDRAARRRRVAGRAVARGAGEPEGQRQGWPQGSPEGCDGCDGREPAWANHPGVFGSPGTGVKGPPSGPGAVRTPAAAPHRRRAGTPRRGSRATTSACPVRSPTRPRRSAR